MDAIYYRWVHRHHHHNGEVAETLYEVSRVTTPLVALADIKKHLRVDHNDDDSYIGSLVEAVTVYLEGDAGELQRSLRDQTWDLNLSHFPHGYRDDSEIVLPLPPHVSVDSIKYSDSTNVLQTFDPVNYEVVGLGTKKGARIRLLPGALWPLVFHKSEPVTVRFRSGYLNMGDSPPSEAVPQAIKQAINLLVGSLYSNREEVIVGQTAIKAPWSAEQLLRPYRVYR